MLDSKNVSLNKVFPYLLAICFVANATALFSEIMGPDATLYASIAKQMVQNNDFLNLYGNGADWLDKPHLPFWLGAISYKIFGINSFAYKFPNFLAYLMACFYTYTIGKKFFTSTIAKLSTLIFACSLHIVLCNFDVRAEVFLTAFILASIYHIYQNITTSKFKYIVFASFFAALAIMTKGIFVLITIGAGFVFYWLNTKQWNEFLKLKWYVLVFLTLIFILPELYCLYTQFDIHPEKIVFGKQGVSGIKFFFWDSQFGRFFNNGPITGNGESLFFVHTTLWAFLPWSIALIVAAIFIIKEHKNNDFKVNNPVFYILNGSALITFIMFNASKFQLPHYIVIIFPHFSFLTGYFLSNLKQLKLLILLHYSLLFVLALAMALAFTMSYFFGIKSWAFFLLTLPLILYVYIVFFKQHTSTSFAIKGVCIMFFLTIFFNTLYFPNLMQYQGGMMAGKFQKKHLLNTVATMYKCNDYNFEFYGDANLKRANQASVICTINYQPKLILGFKRSFNDINKDSFSIKIIKYFPDFHISEMKAEFINPSTRANVTDSFYLAYCTKIK